jgi:riboflavin kinase/FMN adenylyltransferase
MPSGCVITIGNFDGVHVGHAAILREARQLAVSLGAAVKALTFDPHPASVLRPGRQPLRLTSLPEKRGLLLEAGADEVIVLEPAPALLAMEPRDFIADLVALHQPEAIVEGVDFRFGRGRAGDIHLLESLGPILGFVLAVVPDAQVALSDHLLAPVSSSLVRWLLSHGRVVDAAIGLGRPFELCGPVVRGDQRGRSLGIPTANLDAAAIAGRAIPGDGVYAGAAMLPDGQSWPAAISVGVKPTFPNAARTIEAHLLGFSGDLYGQTVTIRFNRWLREQQPFPSLKALKSQLLRDVAQVARLCELDGQAGSWPEGGPRNRHRPYNPTVAT